MPDNTEKNAPAQTQPTTQAETQPMTPAQTQPMTQAETQMMPAQQPASTQTQPMTAAQTQLMTPAQQPTAGQGPQQPAPVQSPVAIPSPVQSLPERKGGLPRWAIALLVVVLLAAAAGVTWLTYDQEVWGGKTVPSVVGMSEADATQALQALGFAVEVEYASVDDDFGTVLSCSPEPGQRVDPAGGAVITVSAERTIPHVVGLAQEEAERAVLDAGAAGIVIKLQSSDEPEGTVVAVSPGEGEPFRSTDEVTLTIAEPFKVPDVLGLTLSEARDAVEAAGLSVSVTYVESDAQKNEVVDVSPAAGESVSSETTVELSVSSPFPTSPSALLEYFEAEPEQISEYLADEGFTVQYGSIYVASGNADAVYRAKSGDLVQFSDDPESPSTGSESGGDVLAQGATIGGVRYAFSADSVPDDATVESEEGVRAVMEACGLTGLTDTCTQEDVVLPEGMAGEKDLEGAHFICASGQTDGYVWAVLIGGREGSTKVIALAAPASHFDDIDLSEYDGKVCNYVVGADLFAR